MRIRDLILVLAVSTTIVSGCAVASGRQSAPGPQDRTGGETPNVHMEPTSATDDPYPSPTVAVPDTTSATPPGEDGLAIAQCPTQGNRPIVQNPDKVQQLSRWGNGQVETTVHGPLADFLALETPLGVYIREIQSLDEAQFLLGALETATTPDKRMLAVAFMGPRLELWDLDAGTKNGSADFTGSWPDKAVDDGAGISPTSIAYSPSEDLVAITLQTGQTGIVDTKDVSLRHEIISGFDPGSLRTIFSPDGQYLLIVNSEVQSSAQIWDTSSGELVTRVSGPGHMAWRPFRPDGKRILTTAQNGTIRAYSVPEGRVEEQFDTEYQWPSVEYSRDGDYVLLLNGQQVRDPEDGHLVKSVPPSYARMPPLESEQLKTEELVRLGHFPGAFSLHDNEEGQLEAWGVEGSTAFRWTPAKNLYEPFEIGSVELGRAWSASEDGPFSIERVKISPDGSMVGSCTADVLFVTRVDEGSRFTLSGCGKTQTFGFAAESDSVLVGGNQAINKIRLRDGENLETIQVNSGNPYFIQLVGEGSLLVTSTWSFNGIRAQVWSSDLQERIGDLAGIQDRIVAVDMLPGGEHLLTADTKVRIWDPASLQLLNELDIEASTIALSPEGSGLAVGTPNGSIYLYSLPEGKELAALQGHAGPVASLEFALDGNSLYSAGEDGSVRLWGAPACEENACEAVGEREPMNCTGEIAIRKFE